MVAVVSGSSLGLFNSSLALLGSTGSVGDPKEGRPNSGVYINSATGNLIVQAQDDALKAAGLDLALVRTYNSQGLLNDDNGDNWRLGVYESLAGLTGSVNTANSTITKTFGDGAAIVYRYDTTLGYYVSSDGDGANDTLSYNSSTSEWTWRDGSSRATEVYNSSGRLLSSRDADNNTISYTYTGNLITQITDASGQNTYLDYTGNNLTQIRVVSNGVTQTLTRYTYDGQNRLSQVRVDLTPTDNAIADNNYFLTTYTYEGTSTRISTISQGSATTVGSSVGFTYELASGLYRVKTYTDGEGKVTTLTYTGGGAGQTTAAANGGVLSTTDTVTTTNNYSLNTGALTTPGPTWGTATAIDTQSAAVSDPRLAFASNGNGIAIWREGANLWARTYTASTNSWSATPVALDTLSGTISNPQLSVDASGNALVVWIQNDGSVNSLYGAGYDAASGTWTAPFGLESSSIAVSTNTSGLSVSVNGSNAVVSWLQPTSGTTNDVWVTRWTGSGWSTPVTIDSQTSAATKTSIAVDVQGNVIVVFEQGSPSRVYANRWNNTTATWSGAAVIDTQAAAATDPRFAFAASGNGIVMWREGANLWSRTYFVATNTWAATPVLLDNMAGAISNFQAAVDAAGNAVGAWIQNDGTVDNLYAVRYEASTNTLSAPVLVETGGIAVSGATDGLSVSINGSQAAISWLQPTSGTVNDAWVTRWTGSAWSTPVTVDSQSTSAAKTAVAIDAQGNISVLIQQDSTSNIYANRLTNAAGSGAPYYTIPAGASWQSLANALYGVDSAAAGTALQTAMGGGAVPASGTQVTGWPSTLSVTTTTVQTVPAYYTVLGTDTWSTITQSVYGTGDSGAVTALQVALGNPTLTTGLHLTVPATLTYTPSSSSGSATQVDIASPLGLVTTMVNDAQGRLTNVLSPTVGGSRLETKYAYDASGNVTSITEDPTGANRVTTNQYDASGNLTLTRDAIGNTITRTYSADNQIVTETLYTVPDPDGVGSGQPSGAVTTRYAYDSEDHLRFAITADGRVTEYRYNAAGRRTSAITYAGGRYDVSALASTATLSESQLNTWVGTQNLQQIELTEYTYDFRGNISTITAYASTNSLGQGAGAGASVSRYVYDQRGNLLSKIDPLGETTSGDPNDYVTTYTYDGLGRLLGTVRWTPDGNVTSISNSYNDGTRTQTTTEPSGLVTTTVVDRVGRVVSISRSNGTFGTTTYKYDADGHLRMVTDPLGIKTQYVYDAAGRKLFSVDGNGTLTEFIYDRTSNVVKTVRYAVAANTSLLVDGTGTPLATVDTTALRNSANGQAAQNLITRAVYDGAHRVVYSIDETGAVTKNIYDGASRLVSQLQYATRVAISAATNELTLAADGSISGVTLSTSTDDRIVRSFYDNDGNLTGTLDGAGYLTKYVYDAAGHRTQTIRYYNATVASQRATGTLDVLTGGITLDASRDIVTYDFYDGEGRRVGSLDGEKYLTQWVYDATGNVKQEIRFPSPRSFTGTPTFSAVLPATTTGAHITSYDYNEVHQLTLVTSYEGFQTRYKYDAVGHLIQTTTALNTSVGRTTQARYDAAGRMTAELTAEGSARIAALTNPTQAQIDGIWSQYSVAYAYDNDDRRISMTDQYGNVTLFFYDADGRQRFSVACVAGGYGEVTEQRYNALGQMTERVQYVNRVSTSGFASGDINGTLTATVATAALGVADNTKDLHTYYTYTSGGQVLTQTAGEGGTLTTTYNAFGEVATRSQLIEGTTTVDSTYTYDQRGLLLATHEDPLGIDAAVVRTYDAFGRLKSATDANGNLTQYAYDRIGRTVTVTDPFTNTDQTTYDAFSRVLTTTDRLGQVTQYVYDDVAHSVRVTTPEGVSVLTVHNEQGQTSTITDGNNNVVHYDYDENGRLTRVYDSKGDISQQTYDRAGRGIDTIDSNGVITRIAYDAASRVYTRTVDPGGLNRTTTYSYDGAGQTLTVTDERNVVTQTTYDRDGNVTSVLVDPTGLKLKTTYTYDKRDELRITTEGVDTGVGVANPRTVTYAYDKLGRRISETVVIGNGQPDAVTQYKYDDNGNVTRKIGPGTTPSSTWYVYDANNRLRVTIDALGGVTKTEYDAADRITSTYRYANPLGSVASLSDTPTLSDINTLGLPQTSTADRLEETIYDRDGRAVYTVNRLSPTGNGVLTQKDYDANGNVVHQRVFLNTISGSVARTKTAIDTARVPDTTDRESFTTYDIRNRAIFQIDAAGNVTRNEYDGNGNVIATTQYATTRATSVTPTEATMLSWAGSNTGASDRVTRYWYDAAGRKAFTLDAEGYLSETRYTDSTRTEETFRYLAKPSTALTSASTLQQVRNAIVATPSTDRYTKTEYDTGGRVSKVTDAFGNYEQYTYDSAGNKITYRNQKGSVWNYSYDANHRLTDEVSPYVDIWATDTVISAGATNARITTHMTYDALGNVRTRTEAFGRPDARTTTYEYDALGRQTRTIFPSINVYSANPTTDAAVAGSSVVRVESTVSQPDAVVTYNALGDAVMNRDVAGNYTHKVYDNLGRLRYDVDAQQYVTEHVYDSFGNEISTIRYASPLTAGLAANTAWTLAEVQSHLPLAQPTVDRTLVKTYDRVNRLTQVTQPAAFNYAPAAGTSSSGGTSYASVGPATVYDYNAFGEVARQRQLVSPGNYADTYYYFDHRGQQIAQVDARGYLSIAEYDALGNKTRSVEYAKALGTRPTTPGGSYSGLVTTTPLSSPADAAGYDRETLFTYDRLNRLKTQSVVNLEYTTISGDVTTTQTNGVQTTTYDYDALGNRTVVTFANGATTYTYYDVLGRVVGVAEPARDVNGTNTTTITFTWTPVGDEHFSYRLQGSATWTTLEVSGGVSIGSLPNGTYEYSFNYSAYDPRYGSPTSSGGSVGTFTVNGASSTWSQTSSTNAPAMTFTAIPPPADSSTTLTPYTEMLRDAYGNVVIQAQWGGGATGVSVNGATRSSIGATDRITRNQVDSYGHVLRTTDAEGGVVEKSYDVRGYLMKEWQRVTYNDSVTGAAATDAIVTIYQYDTLGRQTAVIEPGRLDAIQQIIRTDVGYNGFGEITSKTVNGNQTEYYDYDQAGRVWRTNAGDGVHKVYLYDLQGNKTAEIRSQNRDLKTYIASPQAALALGGADQVRIETRYDLMGHALEQRQVTFDSPAAQEAIGAPVQFGNLTMPNPPNAVYQRIAGQEGNQSYEYWVLNPTSYAQGGGWTQVAAPTAANPAGSYTRVDAANYSISSRGFLYWDAPAQQGLSKAFKYRVPGAQNWLTLPVTSVTQNQLGVDISAIASNSYEYRIEYTRAGDSSAYAIETGAFTVNNSNVTTVGVSSGGGVPGFGIDSYSLSGTSLTVTWGDLYYGSGVAYPPSYFEVRKQGTSTWISFPSSYVNSGTMYVPGYNTATASNMQAGDYDYRIRYVSNNQIQQCAVGTIHVSAPSGTVTTITSQTPAGAWNNPLGALSASTATAQVGSADITFSWPYTHYSEYFTFGPQGSGNYQTFGVGGVAALGSLSNGTYDWSLTVGYEDPKNGWTALGGAGGTFVVNGQNSYIATNYSTYPAVSLTAVAGPPIVTTYLSWPIDSSNTGYKYFQYRPVGAVGWTPATVYTSGSYYQVAIPSLSGAYEFNALVGTASSSGTFTVSGTTATVTSQVNSPYYLSGVTASGSTLYWSRAVQSGETLSVYVGTASGNVQLTPHTSDGVNYWASLDNLGLTTNSYGYYIEYQRGGVPYVQGRGTISVSSNAPPPTASISQGSLGAISGFYDAGNGLLAWTTAASGGSVQVRYRGNGAPDWEGSLSATAYGSGYAVNINSPTQLVGLVQFEVQYINANGVMYALGYTQANITRSISTSASASDTTSATLAPVSVTPRTQQTFDRWGNVLTSISAALAQTDYRYNQFGAVAQVTLPLQDIVSTINGGVAAYFSTRPIQRNYFDILGRVIATRDGDANRVSNGKMNQVQYNAAGQVLLETRADGATKSYVYDSFGQQIQTTDELGYRTRMAYDRTGYLTAQAHEILAGGFSTATASDMTASSTAGIVRNDYTYDRAGRRLSATTGEVLNGASTAETVRYWYDLRGNVIKTKTPLLRVTTYEYDIYGNKTLERNANNDTQLWDYDAYGRMQHSTDMGGAVTTYNYNGITKYLTSQTNTLGQNISYGYDAAGHLTTITDRGTAGSGLQGVVRDTTYSYDAAGRRSRERVVIDGILNQDTHITYDAQDRIKQLSDLRYTLAYSYDDSGNRTRIKATYYDHGGIARVQDLWYKYDAMNRVLISQGINTAGDTQTSGTVDIGSAQGVKLTYDAKGQRSSATQYGPTLSVVNGSYSLVSEYNTESYGYDGTGHLTTVNRLLRQLNSGVPSTSTLQSELITYDKTGRELSDITYEYTPQANGTLTTTTRSSASNYDDDGRVTNQTTAKNGVKESYVIYGDSAYQPLQSVVYQDPWTGMPVSYTWGGAYTPGYDAGGVLRGYIVQVYNTNTTGDPNDIAYTTTYSIDYRKGSTYQEIGQSASSTAGAGYPQSAVPQSGSTTRTYNVNGELVATADSRDATKNRYFANDATGNAITVVQGLYDGLSGHMTPTQAIQSAIANSGSWNFTKAQHFFSALGQQVGSYGQLADSSGTFKANFDVNYTPVSSSYPDSAPSEVVAQQGDTLRTLAARVFGDQSLWYVIAQENGLTDPDAQITPGTVVRIPNQVVSMSNTANSFKPFDVQTAIGDTSPTQPIPPQPAPRKAKGCGIIGQIIIIVIVIIVTIYTAGAASAAAGAGGTAGAGATGATAASTTAASTAGASAAGAGATGAAAAGTTAVGASTSLGAAALGAAAGNAAGQLAAMAMGMQSSFSWKSVGLSAVGGAITAGLGSSSAFQNAIGNLSSNAYVQASLAAVASNAITQGAGIVLGLQDRFDWKSVAASAASAPASMGASQYGKSVSYAAGAVTGAAVVSAVGGKFNVQQVVADVFGNAIGNSIVSMQHAAAAEAETTDRLAKRGFPKGGFDPSDYRNSELDALTLGELGMSGLAGATQLSNNPSNSVQQIVSPDELRNWASDAASTVGPLQEVVVTGTYTGSDPEVAARIAARQSANWGIPSAPRQFVGPANGSLIGAFFGSRWNAFRHDLGDLRRSLVSGEPLITGSEIAGWAKGMGSLVRDGFVQMLPFSEGTEFGQQAMQRQTARVGEATDAIVSTVRESRSRAELALDLWRAGDSVSAGSLAGEESYAYQKFAMKEAAMAVGPFAAAKIGGLGTLGELGAADELLQAGAADTLLGRTAFRAAPKSGFAFETKLVRDGDFTSIELTSNNAFDAEGRLVASRFKRSNLVAQLDAKGELHVQWYSTDVSDHHIGREMLSTAIETLGPSSVRTVSANFALDNLDAYQEYLRQGALAGDAAWRTPFGRAMRDLGFGNVDTTRAPYSVVFGY